MPSDSSEEEEEEQEDSSEEEQEENEDSISSLEQSPSKAPSQGNKKIRSQILKADEKARAKDLEKKKESEQEARDSEIQQTAAKFVKAQTARGGGPQKKKKVRARQPLLTRGPGFHSHTRLPTRKRLRSKQPRMADRRRRRCVRGRPLLTRRLGFHSHTRLPCRKRLRSNRP